VLVRTYRKAEAHGTELRLVVPSAAVRRVFELMGVDELLAVYRTLGEAMEGAPGEPGDQAGGVPA
jgi:anti-anti-sigma regulatory factor